MVRKGLILLLVTWMLTATGFAADSAEWLAEFNDSCAKTTEAMELSREELLALIAKCERVKKAVESQDEAVRKVYMKRVQMCLDLFKYVVETKAPDVKGAPSAK